MDKKKESGGIREEKGAVIIEASIVLPLFMFMMITLYSIIQIAYVQARITVALDCSAKELAQYAHVFYSTGMNEIFTGEGGASSTVANKVAEFLTTVGENFSSVDSELGQYVTNAGTALSGDSITAYGLAGLGQTLGEQMMKKNMVNGLGDTSDAFKKRNHITRFDMLQSKILEGKGKEIFLRADYDVEVIRLLNIDFTFHLSSCAYTEAWG